MQDAEVPGRNPTKIFYGWWVVLVSSIGLSSNPGQFAFGSLGLFIIPLGDAFGWTRTEVSLALTLFTVALACSQPAIGALVDRYGSKKVLIPSTIIFALLLAAIPAFVSELWHFLLIFVLIGSLAAGANAMPYLRILGAWFDRKRGLAYGLALSGAGVGYAYVPPMLDYLISNYGWRSGYYVLTSILLVVTVPLLWFFLRDDPKEAGLASDGSKVDAHEPLDTPSLAPSVEGEVEGLEWRQAIRGKVFWLLFPIFVIISLSLYGMLAHFVPMLTDGGMTTQRAALAAGTLGVTIVVSRPVIGVLLDRYFAPFIALVCFLISAVGFLILSVDLSGPHVYAVAVLIGLSLGAELDLLAFLTSRYFGMRSFGVLYGMQFSGFMIGASLGPVLYGMTFDMNGNYQVILRFSAVFMCTAAAMLALLPRYPSLGVPAR
ncbi:MAG: MFS family permease [Halioglobus sp.]|jgi:MFS family permease